MSDTTDFTVTLDGPRLARARHAVSHIAHMFFDDRDRPAFVADLARVSPLALAAWLSGRAMLRFKAESPAARDEADEIDMARRIAEDVEPFAPVETVRVVPASRSPILPAIGAAIACAAQRGNAHITSADLFEGAGMPDLAEEQRARARGLQSLCRELVGLWNVEVQLATGGVS